MYCSFSTEKHTQTGRGVTLNKRCLEQWRRRKTKHRKKWVYGTKKVVVCVCVWKARGMSFTSSFERVFMSYMLCNRSLLCLVANESVSLMKTRAHVNGESSYMTYYYYYFLWYRHSPHTHTYLPTQNLPYQRRRAHNPNIAMLYQLFGTSKCFSRQ